MRSVKLRMNLFLALLTHQKCDWSDNIAAISAAKHMLPNNHLIKTNNFRGYILRLSCMVNSNYLYYLLRT